MFALTYTENGKDGHARDLCPMMPRLLARLSAGTAPAQAAPNCSGEAPVRGRVASEPLSSREAVKECAANRTAQGPEAMRNRQGPCYFRTSGE